MTEEEALAKIPQEHRAMFKQKLDEVKQQAMRMFKTSNLNMHVEEHKEVESAEKQSVSEG